MSNTYIDRLISRLDTQDIAIEHHGTSFTGRHLLSSIHHYARTILELGVGCSSLVAIYAPNNIDAIAVRYAANLLGGAYIYLPLYPDADRRREMLLGIEPDVLVFFKETQWALEGLGNDWRSRLMLVGVGLEAEGAHLVQMARRTEQQNTATHPITSLAQSDALCAVISSGGSTGPPKASWRTFAQYTSNTNLSFTPDRRQLINGPLANLSHILLDATLLGGGTVILDDRFDSGRVLRHIQSQGVTDLFLVELQLALLLDHDDLASTDLSKLQTVTHVGDTAPLALRQRAAKVFGGRMRQAYAASESAMVAIFSGTDYTAIKPGMLNSCGRIMPGVKLQVRSPVTDDILEDGNPGRVEIQGQSVASGYRPAPKLIQPAPRFIGQGKILLNDIIRKHGDFLEFLGREGEVVYAAEWGIGRPTTATQMQDTLLRLDNIKYAAVLRDVKTSTWIAAAVPRNMARAHCLGVEKRLKEEHQVDRLCVLVLNELPLTPQGKVDRASLLAEAPKAPSTFFSRGTKVGSRSLWWRQYLDLHALRKSSYSLLSLRGFERKWQLLTNKK